MDTEDESRQAPKPKAPPASYHKPACLETGVVAKIQKRKLPPMVDYESEPESDVDFAVLLLTDKRLELATMEMGPPSIPKETMAYESESDGEDVPVWECGFCGFDGNWGTRCEGCDCAKTTAKREPSPPPPAEVPVPEPLPVDRAVEVEEEIEESIEHPPFEDEEYTMWADGEHELEYEDFEGNEELECCGDPSWELGENVNRVWECGFCGFDRNERTLCGVCHSSKPSVYQIEVPEAPQPSPPAEVPVPKPLPVEAPDDHAQEPVAKANPRKRPGIWRSGTFSCQAHKTRGNRRSRRKDACGDDQSPSL